MKNDLLITLISIAAICSPLIILAAIMVSADKSFKFDISNEEWNKLDDSDEYDDYDDLI